MPDGTIKYHGIYYCFMNYMKILCLPKPDSALKYNIIEKIKFHFSVWCYCHEIMNAKHSGVATSAAVWTAGPVLVQSKNKKSNMLVDDREQLYCIVQQCQINLFSFHIYAS
jgi:hypothetical protein